MLELMVRRVLDSMCVHCTVCTMKHEVCGGKGRCTIGQASTNQKSRKRYRVSIANAKGEPLIDNKRVG